MAVIIVSLQDTFNQWLTKTNDISAILGDFSALTSSELSLVEAVNENNANIGTLGDLTTNQTDLVIAINEVDSDVASLDVDITSVEGEIGNLTLLETVTSDDLVSAINEVNGNVDSSSGEIGILTNLTTDAKADLVVAVNEVDDHTDTNTTDIGTNTTAIGTLGDLTTIQTDLVIAINEVDGHADTNTTNIGTNTTSIGTLSALSTSVKTDLVVAINEVDGHADTNATSIGTLGDLTTIQTDLVIAINEVDGHADTNATSIGTLANLTTSTQTDLVVAINSLSDISYLGTELNDITDMNSLFVYGMVNGTATTIVPVVDTPAIILGFGSNTSQGVTVSAANGTITIPTTGVYMVNAKLIFTCATKSVGYTFTLDIDGTKTVYDTLYIGSTATPTKNSLAFMLPLSLTAANVLKIYIEADAIGNDLSDINALLSVERKTL